MPKRNKRVSRDANVRIKQIWERWEARARALSRTGSRKDVGLLAADMMRSKMNEGGAVVLSMDELTAEHHRVHRLTMKQAVDEVESFAKRAMDKLSKRYRLIHPVTEYGIAHAEGAGPDDVQTIRRCVPGTGDKTAGPTRGWRVAHLENDPCYLAYVNHGLRQVNGAYSRTQEQVSAASSVGILPAATALPSIPSSIETESAR